jgi:hypothetical protein
VDFADIGKKSLITETFFPCAVPNNMTPRAFQRFGFRKLGEYAPTQRFGGKQAMNVEQLDGFFAALICCPSDIAKNEYLPEIWGDEMINEDAFGASHTKKPWSSTKMRSDS